MMKYISILVFGLSLFVGCTTPTANTHIVHGVAQLRIPPLYYSVSPEHRKPRPAHEINLSPFTLDTGNRVDSLMT